MENQSLKKQQASRRISKTKKQSNQPRYSDQAWQAGQSGQNKNDAQKDAQNESCGCGS